MHFPADANISRILEDLVVVSIIFSNYRYQTIDYDICKKICAVQQGVPSADNSSVWPSRSLLTVTNTSNPWPNIQVTFRHLCMQAFFLAKPLEQGSGILYDFLMKQTSSGLRKQWCKKMQHYKILQTGDVVPIPDMFPQPSILLFGFNQLLLRACLTTSFSPCFRSGAGRSESIVGRQMKGSKHHIWRKMWNTIWYSEAFCREIIQNLGLNLGGGFVAW